MKNIYLFAGEHYMAVRAYQELKQSLDIPYAQINVTEYKTMPAADTLFEACVSVPFMAEKRLVAVRDASVLSKGSADEAKRIAEFIDRIPDTTVLVLCTDAADKRRALYKKIKTAGEVREFAQPRQQECMDFVIEQADKNGARISRAAAAALVEAAGCDYHALENETAKLAVYGGGQITAADIAVCAARSLEYNVFEIHGLFINRQVTRAYALLDDILSAEAPEALIGLFARKLRDMYKTRSMLDAGYRMERIADMLGVRGFIARRLIGECRDYSQRELRKGLVSLADLDFAIKSGQKDAWLALPETLLRIYKI